MSRVGRRRHRVICPVCRQVRGAAWAPNSPGVELVIYPHDRPPLGGLVLLDGLGKPVQCRGTGRRVGPEAAPPPVRQVSYEETVRRITALLGEGESA